MSVGEMLRRLLGRREREPDRPPAEAVELAMKSREIARRLDALEARAEAIEMVKARRGT